MFSLAFTIIGTIIITVAILTLGFLLITNVAYLFTRPSQVEREFGTKKSKRITLFDVLADQNTWAFMFITFFVIKVIF